MEKFNDIKEQLEIIQSKGYDIKEENGEIISIKKVNVGFELNELIEFIKTFDPDCNLVETGKALVVNLKNKTSQKMFMLLKSSFPQVVVNQLGAYSIKIPFNVAESKEDTSNANLNEGKIEENKIEEKIENPFDVIKGIAESVIVNPNAEMIIENNKVTLTSLFEKEVEKLLEKLNNVNGIDGEVIVKQDTIEIKIGE